MAANFAEMENETNSAENNNQGVTRAAGIVSIAVMMSRILGLARETAIGYYFPSKGSADAFYLAFRIPNFLRSLFRFPFLRNLLP